MPKDLLDQVYGCLAAGAVGDALGAPVEGWYYTEIREKHGKVEEFGPFKTGYSNGAPGTMTDDSVMRHYMCLSIIEKGGRILPDDFGKTWVEKLNPDRLWVNERIVTIKLKQGMNPWHTGQGNIPAGCASMAIVPIGIINAGDPEQAFQDGMNIAGVDQTGSNQEAAASIAAATAQAFVPGATVDDVIETMYRYSSWFMRRAYDLTMDIANSSSGVDDFTEKYYAKMLDWSWPQRTFNKDRYFSGNSHEFVPVVMALLKLCDGDVNRCLIEGASFGRDCDTISSIVGSIAGVMHGASAIRAYWIEQCEAANGEFYREVEGDESKNLLTVAERLVACLRNERTKARTRSEFLSSLF